MNDAWLSFLGFSLLAIVVQGLFAIFEMAGVSFSKVRLHYFASLGQKRAIWLSELLQTPSRLFGTTLIGINASLQIGSECARRFYESLGVNPDIAPLSQAILVILFGELVPLFSGRRHPEQFAMALAPLMILISRLLSPVIWLFDLLSKGINRVFGQGDAGGTFLSREEVQKAFEEKDTYTEDFNELVSRIFKMKTLTASTLMTPLTTLQPISSDTTVQGVKERLEKQFAPYLTVYHRHMQNIVAIVYVRDLLALEPKKKILDAAKPPWFVTKDTSLLQILEQFKRNNQTLAVILDASGQALGVLSLDQIIDAIFGEQRMGPLELEKGGLYVEKTVLGSLEIEQFNRQFQTNLIFERGDTLSDLIVKTLGHHPVKGESVEIESYEFTVLEPSLRGAKLISVRTVE